MRFQKGDNMPKVTIAGARITKGLSQAELAEMIGASRAAVQKWETGKADIRVSYLKRIADLTGFKMDDFILPKEYANGV